MTLLEVLATLIVVGILAGIAVPNLREFLLDGQRTADVNGFVLAVQLARSEAAKRGRPVIVCATLDRVRCERDGARYSAGWMVFENSDDLRPPERAPDEPLIFAHAPELRGSIRSNRAVYDFRPYLRRSTNGSVVFCDTRGAAAARAVIVSYTGRPRVDGRAADGGPLTCEALP